MSGIMQRGTLRWKEWVPLVSQQQRLRNLIQVIAYNICVDEKILKREKGVKWSYYYTLHLTTMSSPLYTSEKLESENPKWSEIEINHENGAASGIIVRLWLHTSLGDDHVVTLWGVYFSGLVYLGPRLVSSDPGQLGPNTLVFHMHGGYFTAPHCFLQPHPATPRTLSVKLNASQVKPSYTVNLLLRLQTMQLAIKRQASSAKTLRERICAGGGPGAGSSDISSSMGRESITLRRLLKRPKPTPLERQKLLAVRKEIEMVKFKVSLLSQEKDRGQSSLRRLIAQKENLVDQNQDRSSELMEKYCALQRDIDQRKLCQEVVVKLRCQLSHINALLDMRRKQLMAELGYIYPICQAPDGKYLIRDVHLPNSEDLEGKNEIMISVALGFVAHLVQMMAYFLNIPTRYPILHFGSRSKIIDHIIDKVPDRDREFPLFSRGKEKVPFDYAVYLLNKNIAQLRWCYGITTSDLRATLPNLSALMSLNKNQNMSIGFRSERTQSVVERSCGSGRLSRRQKSVSCSLDDGLEGVSVAYRNEYRARHRALTPGSEDGLVRRRRDEDEEGASDPQAYTGRPVPSSRPTQLTDLASLMSLDIPLKRHHPPHHRQLNGDSPRFVPGSNSYLSSTDTRD